MINTDQTGKKEKHVEARPSAPRHANMDEFDPKKGQGAQFRIHQREKLQVSAQAEDLAVDDDFHVWQSSQAFQKQTRIVLALITITVAIGFVSAVSMNRSFIISKIATETDNRIFSMVAEVNPDIVASALNEINVGE